MVSAHKRAWGSGGGSEWTFRLNHGVNYLVFQSILNVWRYFNFFFRLFFVFV